MTSKQEYTEESDSSSDPIDECTLFMSRTKKVLQEAIEQERARWRARILQLETTIVEMTSERDAMMLDRSRAVEMVHENQQRSFADAAQPLIQWMGNNGTQYIALVTPTSAALVTAVQKASKDSNVEPSTPGDPK